MSEQDEHGAGIVWTDNEGRSIAEQSKVGS
jgi:hypothetical protein